ncbi:MAG: hypothetical protein QF493_11165 [Rhodospirillales bacterium]|nr:hypothetical protein [Rhodospirillales bacterium]
MDPSSAMAGTLPPVTLSLMPLCGGKILNEACGTSASLRTLPPKTA